MWGLVGFLSVWVVWYPSNKDSIREKVRYNRYSSIIPSLLLFIGGILAGPLMGLFVLGSLILWPRK
jgi:hypothetical protein